jgi:hypothetical protein
MLGTLIDHTDDLEKGLLRSETIHWLETCLITEQSFCEDNSMVCRKHCLCGGGKLNRTASSTSCC